MGLAVSKTPAVTLHAPKVNRRGLVSAAVAVTATGKRKATYDDLKDHFNLPPWTTFLTAKHLKKARRGGFPDFYVLFLQQQRAVGTGFRPPMTPGGSPIPCGDEAVNYSQLKRAFGFPALGQTLKLEHFAKAKHAGYSEELVMEIRDRALEGRKIAKSQRPGCFGGCMTMWFEEEIVHPMDCSESDGSSSFTTTTNSSSIVMSIKEKSPERKEDKVKEMWHVAEIRRIRAEEERKRRSLERGRRSNQKNREEILQERAKLVRPGKYEMSPTRIPVHRRSCSF